MNSRGWNWGLRRCDGKRVLELPRKLAACRRGGHQEDRFLRGPDSRGAEWHALFFSLKRPEREIFKFRWLSPDFSPPQLAQLVGLAGAPEETGVLILPGTARPVLDGRARVPRGQAGLAAAHPRRPPCFSSCCSLANSTRSPSCRCRRRRPWQAGRGALDAGAAGKGFGGGSRSRIHPTCAGLSRAAAGWEQRPAACAGRRNKLGYWVCRSHVRPNPTSSPVRQRAQDRLQPDGWQLRVSQRASPCSPRAQADGTASRAPPSGLERWSLGAPPASRIGQWSAQARGPPRGKPGLLD